MKKAKFIGIYDNVSKKYLKPLVENAVGRKMPIEGYVFMADGTPLWVIENLVTDESKIRSLSDSDRYTIVYSGTGFFNGLFKFKIK